MKIERNTNIKTTDFGDICKGGLFEYAGVLYMKIGPSGHAGNCHEVGCGDVFTFTSGVKVVAVTKVVYSLDTHETA